MAVAGSEGVLRGANARQRELQRPFVVKVCGTRALLHRELVVHDISTTGLLVDADAEFVPNKAVEIELPGIGLCGTHVAWTGERFSGLSFDSPMPGAASVTLAQSAFADVAIVEDASPAAHSDTPGSEKLPVGMRLAVITGLAAACWVPFIALGWLVFA